jgi:Nucleotide modification associated domain 2
MKINSNIYVYKLTTDNGGAPCVFKGELSLAICKPTIRKTIDEKDWIIGFGGRSTIGERLIFIAEVEANLKNGKYYKDEQYFERPDCIYHWNEKKEEYFWEKGKKYHRYGELIEHDLGSKVNNYDRANVLISDNFNYFGKNGTEEYKSIFPSVKELVENLSQGHRLNHPIELRKELIRLINLYIIQKKDNAPSQEDKSLICNNKEDCHKIIKAV